MHYEEVLIYMVDEWNWSKVRKGTEEAIRKLGLSVIYEREVRMTCVDTHTERPKADEEWCSGIYVAVLKKREEH